MLTDRLRTLSFPDNSTVRSFSFIAYSVANIAFLAFTLRMPVKSNPRENFHLYQFGRCLHRERSDGTRASLVY